jgi:hypothetical protein
VIRLRDRVQVGEHQLGVRSPSRRASSPPMISATRAWAPARAAELEHICAQVVRFD